VTTEGSRASVLLAAHSADERAFYGACLIAAGFAVWTADGPHDAFAHAVQNPPTVIITRQAPAGHGVGSVELLHLLKGHAATAHIPVIVITSMIQPERRTEAIEAGCAGYLLLPVVPDTLITEMRRVLSTRNGEQSVA
jgi:two-component system, cell cycle response regulator DivK